LTRTAAQRENTSPDDQAAIIKFMLAIASCSENLTEDRGKSRSQEAGSFK
jgi:hypothetical protein